MQILARFCLLIVACSVLEVYKRFLLFYLGLLMMDCASFLKSLTQNSDFGCGFLVFGCFPQVFNIFGLILMLCLGLKVLQFSLHGRGLVQFLCDIRGKSSHLRNGLCSKIGFGEECDAKIVSCNCGPLKFLENSKSKCKSKEVFNQNIDFKAKDVSDIDDDDDDDNDERKCCEEDQVVDVMTLRKLVKNERHRANKALMELEKERMAAASAADEAMAMILRLQSEKSTIEIEANQYHRLAEQKQEYDKEVIQSLQWIVMKHESERSLLEDKLTLCIKKLKQYVKDDDHEMKQFEEFDASLSVLNCTVEDNIHDNDGLISSLDMEMESSEW